MKEWWQAFGHLWYVSSKGRVRNNSGKLLKLRFRRDGYIDVKLSYKRYLVHRLVAKLFIPNPGCLPQVNHKDGVRSNADVENLEWVDQKQNMAHALANGLFPDRKGEANGRACITEEDAIQIKQDIETGEPMTNIARRRKVTYHTVTSIKYGRAWKWKVG